jgi:hypothetical protein
MASNTLDKTTDGGLSYAVLSGYPKITRSRNSGDSAVTKVRIAAGDEAAFFDEMLPLPIIQGGGLFHPTRPSLPSYPMFVVASCNSEPLVSSQPGDDNDYRVVTVNYETTENEDDDEEDPNDPQTFLTISGTVHGQYIKRPLAGAEWTWEGLGTKIDDPNVVAHHTLPMIELNARWKWVVDPPWDAINSSGGKLNDAVVAYLGNAPVECARFDGASFSQEFLISSETGIRRRPYTLDYKFAIRIAQDADGNPITWNHMWNSKEGGWYKPRSGFNYLFPTTDFSGLFQRNNPNEDPT